MISSILPGVREMRTPLLTGLLWAASLWLVFGARAANSARSREFFADYWPEFLPTSLGIAAIAAGLYFVGSLLVVQRSPIAWITERWQPWLWRTVERLNEYREPSRKWKLVAWRFWQKNHSSWLLAWIKVAARHESGRRPAAIDSWTYNKFGNLHLEGRVPIMRSFDEGCDPLHGFRTFCSTESVDSVNERELNGELLARPMLAQNFVYEIRREQRDVEVRIQMRFPEMYAEIDRLKVEAELRLSIFWPLIVLIAVLGFSLSPWSLIALPIPFLLLRSGFDRIDEAETRTWAPLIAGEVTSPILDDMAAAKERPTDDFRAIFYGSNLADEESPQRAEQSS